jgi:transcriptional regulator with XRE-family HTH domain
MLISPEQSRAARALLNLSQAELAESAHVARATLADFERGARMPTHNNLQAIYSALERAGIVFIPQSGGGPGVRLEAAPKTGMDDQVVMHSEQCRAARAMLSLSQSDLAQQAGVGRSTVADFEASARRPNPGGLASLRNALESSGVIFIEADGAGGPGVCLRK